MAYVENRTIHDADAHVMEFQEKIVEYIQKNLSQILSRISEPAIKTGWTKQQPCMTIQSLRPVLKKRL